MEPQGTKPTMAQVRDRIDRCGDHEYRAALRSAVLMCARVSEVVGVATQSDAHATYGPSGEDAKDEVYDVNGVREKALVIRVRTAKRKGMPRLVGLPADYDPWVRATANYFWEREGQKVFPFTRYALSRFVTDNGVFDGFVWDVEAYSILLERARWNDRGEMVQEPIVKKVEGHLKPFTVHSLRDARALYLLTGCDFDGKDLAIHGGWAINRAEAGVSQVMARYLPIYQEWRVPFPKLIGKAGC